LGLLIYPVKDLASGLGFTSNTAINLGKVLAILGEWLRNFLILMRVVINYFVYKFRAIVTLFTTAVRMAVAVVDTVINAVVPFWKVLKTLFTKGLGEAWKVFKVEGIKVWEHLKTNLAWAIVPLVKLINDLMWSLYNMSLIGVDEERGVSKSFQNMTNRMSEFIRKYSPEVSNKKEEKVKSAEEKRAEKDSKNLESIKTYSRQVAINTGVETSHILSPYSSKYTPPVVLRGKSSVVSPSNILPDIPKMAAGGVVSKPTIVQVAEKGPEIISPIEKLKDMFNQTITVPVSVILDGVEVARATRRINAREITRNGGLQINAGGVV